MVTVCATRPAADSNRAAGVCNPFFRTITPVPASPADTVTDAYVTPSPQCHRDRHQDGGQVRVTACWPAAVTVMLPPQLQLHCEASSSAATCSIVTAEEPGVQGSATTGVQGWGVSVPCAAAVALATWGLASDWHMPNGGMQAASVSVTTPAGVPAVGVWPLAANVDGEVPIEHCSVAPVQTRLGIAPPLNALMAMLMVGGAIISPQLAGPAYAVAMAELDHEVRQLLEARNLAHVATLMADGSPHVSPVWIGIEGDRLAIFSAHENLKVRNLRRDGRIAISISDERNPYRSAIIRGRVTDELGGEEAIRIMDRMSQRYVGRDFPVRSAIVSLIEPDRVRFQDLPFEHPGPG